MVNDAAGVLSAQEVETLERKLVALDDSSSNQIAVVLIKTLGDYDIEEYAQKLFRAWGIGNKKTNNGILFIAAIDDRKMRIHVGYGLEGAIPDITASSIIRNEVAPEFKKQNFYQGIDNAINSISKAAVGEYKIQKEKKRNNSGNNSGSIFGFLILIVIVILFLSRSGRGGGGGSGLGSIANAVILSSLLNGGRGGGGGWGGGDSGGGGFGGFGGGDSGGGGASGSW